MMKFFIPFLLGAVSLSISASETPNSEATVIISAKNLAGRQIVYHRSYNGVYLTTFTPIELSADSTFTLTLPTENVERVGLLTRDPNNKLPSTFQTFYALPGITQVIVDPLAEENGVIVPPHRQ